MHGAGTEKQLRNLREQFDDHEIMIIETFGALNNLVFIEISEY